MNFDHIACTISQLPPSLCLTPSLTPPPPPPPSLCSRCYGLRSAIRLSKSSKNLVATTGRPPTPPLDLAAVS